MITYRIPSLKINIGDHPQVYEHEYETMMDHDVLMNVSDEGPYGSIDIPKKIIHWCPINEFGYWGYHTFFWTVRVLDEAIEYDKRIYLHCHAGAHRSPMIGYLYLRSLGHSPEEAIALFDEKFAIGERTNWLEETFQNDVEYGRIPADVVQFMKDVRAYPNGSLMGVMSKRNVMDLPPKTIEKNGIKKPVGEIQVTLAQKGLFTK
jgi:hypothetical protein